MRRVAIVLAAVLALLVSTQSALAAKPQRGVVRDYASVNGHCPNPEGIAIDPDGNIYTSPAPHIFSGSGPANVCVVSPSLHIREIPISPDSGAGPAQIFADGDTLNARQGTSDALVRADGIMFDVKGNLYVCANVSNEGGGIQSKVSIVEVPHPGLPLFPDSEDDGNE